jgi:hypothetical protein
MNVCIVKLAPYQDSAYVVANCSRDELGAWSTKRWGVEPHRFMLSGIGGQHFTIEKDDITVAYVVWLQQFHWSVQQQALAVHELFHLIRRFLRDVGIRNEEAEAYLLQSVVEQVWFKWKKLR